MGSSFQYKWIPWNTKRMFFIGVSIRYMPCLEQDIFGSVNRSLRFHPHTSAGKVLAPFFSDGPCIGFFSTLHYITSHHMALLWSTYIKLLYITLHYITLHYITLHYKAFRIRFFWMLHHITFQYSIQIDHVLVSFFNTSLNSFQMGLHWFLLNDTSQFIPLRSNTMDHLSKINQIQ